MDAVHVTYILYLAAGNYSDNQEGRIYISYNCTNIKINSRKIVHFKLLI